MCVSFHSPPPPHVGHTQLTFHIPLPPFPPMHHPLSPRPPLTRFSYAHLPHPAALITPSPLPFSPSPTPTTPPQPPPPPLPSPVGRWTYAMTIMMLTFHILLLSTYRNPEKLLLPLARFSMIVLGFLIAALINLALFPAYAGDTLHALLSKNFDSAATLLSRWAAHCSPGGRHSALQVGGTLLSRWAALCSPGGRHSALQSVLLVLVLVSPGVLCCLLLLDELCAPSHTSAS
ncbi:unnamed protein product [Closterium sp. Naga37s-1]|nr:unnamed protein product [Closterium sp. Naga37s-1]